MGLNTPVLILNDAWHEIEADPGFGRSLYNGMMEASHTSVKCGHVPAGNRYSAARVLDCAHADITRVIAVGGNYMTEVASVVNGGIHHTDEAQLQLCREFADRLGYNLVRKRKR